MQLRKSFEVYNPRQILKKYTFLENFWKSVQPWKSFEKYAKVMKSIQPGKSCKKVYNSRIVVITYSPLKKLWKTKQPW